MAVRPRLYGIILALIAVLFVLSSLSGQAVEPASRAASTPAVTKSKPAPKKSPVTRTIETQLSGFTSEDADQLYARLSLRETREHRDWYVRGSFSRTATDYAGYDARVTTSKFDSRLEQERAEDAYDVWTGILSKRERDPATRHYPKRSGYHFLSYGFGRQLDARTKGDIGLGILDIYDQDDGSRPAAISSIRGRRPLSKRLTLDGDILVLQPMDRLRSTKVDSDLGLSYGLAPGLSIRLGWSANNLIRSVRASREWDSVIRLSISFRRTTTR